MIALGIDASLSATGLVAVPYDWGLDWSRVRRATFGRKLSKTASIRETVDRIDDITEFVRAFIAEHRPTVAFLESYAFNVSQNAHSLGELGFALKRLVVKECGLELRLVAATSARALLGKMQRQKKGGPKVASAKDQAHTILTNAGAPLEWTRDELDAFLLANFGLSSIDGADALILREPEPVRAKRRRKAA